MRGRIGLSTLVLLVGTAAADVGGFKHKIPERFLPMDQLLPLETGVPVARDQPLEFDLAAGVPLAGCPAGMWSGTVRYLGHAGGAIDYTGEMYRCFAFGRGTARYPDGSRYEGTVAAYLDGAVESLTTDNVRMAVREGAGRHVRPDGEVMQRIFLRGVASEEAYAPRLARFAQARDRLGLLASDAKFQAVSLEREQRARAEREAQQRAAAAAEAARRDAQERIRAEQARLAQLAPAPTASAGQGGALAASGAEAIVAGGDGVIALPGLPGPARTLADRCFQLFNAFAGDGMKVGRCVGDPRSYASAGALREKERSCVAAVESVSQPARLAYRAECGKARPTDGGASRQ